MGDPRLDYPVGDTVSGQKVQVSKLPGPKVLDAPISADFLWQLSLMGAVFIASAAAANTGLTGPATSYAATTPTLLLDVPQGYSVIPLFLNLSQTGSVAGGAVDVLIEIDNVKRYSSSGTSEKTWNSRRSLPQSKLYSSPTALAGYGARLWGATIGQDVSPAEGAVQGPFWKPEIPYVIDGAGAFIVNTYAGTTAPTWYWTFGFAELPTPRLALLGIS